MNGYSLTDKMRRTRQWVKLTAAEQALFYELVAVCNEKGWQNVFQCPNKKLCRALNMGERTLTKARETLVKAGLIFYHSGKSIRAISSYSFTTAFPTAPPANNAVPTPANIAEYINTLADGRGYL